MVVALVGAAGRALQPIMTARALEICSIWHTECRMLALLLEKVTFQRMAPDFFHSFHGWKAAGKMLHQDTLAAYLDISAKVLSRVLSSRIGLDKDETHD